jgi:hypothetical protein
VCFTEVLLTISAIIRKLDGLDETVNLLTVFCVGKFNGGFLHYLTYPALQTTHIKTSFRDYT